MGQWERLWFRQVDVQRKFLGAARRVLEAKRLVIQPLFQIRQAKLAFRGALVVDRVDMVTQQRDTWRKPLGGNARHPELGAHREVVKE